MSAATDAATVSHLSVLREAVPSDVPGMVVLGAEMHAESRFHVMRWDGEKVGQLIRHLIASEDGLALVVAQGDRIVGGFLGMLAPHFFSPDRMATDLALFVSPGRRGGVLGARMLRAYGSWARSRGAVLVQAGVTTGVNVDSTSRLYASVGFEPVGNLFEFKG